MRIVTALLILTTSTAAVAQTDTKNQPRTLEDAAAEVLKLEDAWAKALVAKDRATFERLLAPKFIYTEDTTTTDRATTLASLIGPDSYTDARNEDMKVQVLGNVAIVTGWLVTFGHGPKGDFYRRYRFTDTWVHGTNWRIIAAHDVLVTLKK